MNFKKILAFSLAEILITLGIVGAVAAMTIPNLNYNRVKKEKSVKLKRFYSKMTSAIETMNLDNRPYRSMTRPADDAAAFDWYMENIDPYMGHKAVNKTAKIIYYADGSSLFIRPVNQVIQACVDAIYDVNGDKGKAGYCYGYHQFHFMYCFQDKQRKDYFGDSNIFFGAYSKNGQPWDRQTLVNGCADKGGDCAALLQYDNWEFKSDYPVRGCWL